MNAPSLANRIAIVSMIVLTAELAILCFSSHPGLWTLAVAASIPLMAAVLGGIYGGSWNRRI